MISKAHKELMRKANQTYAGYTKDWTPRQHWMSRMQAEQDVQFNEERMRDGERENVVR